MAHTQVWERRVLGVCRQWVIRKCQRHEGSSASSVTIPTQFVSEGTRKKKKHNPRNSTNAHTSNTCTPPHHTSATVHKCARLAKRPDARRPPPATNHPPTAARSLPSPAPARLTQPVATAPRVSPSAATHHTSLAARRRRPHAAHCTSDRSLAHTPD